MRQANGRFSTTLFSAFLFCFIGVACVFFVLISVMWWHSSKVLEREQEMAFDLLPDLNVAYQLTAATAGLQSKGLLLSFARDFDELDLRNEQLDETMVQVIHASELFKLDSSDEQIQLTNEISLISTAIRDIKKSKYAELQLQNVINAEKGSLLKFLHDLERTLQGNIVTVGNELFVALDDMEQSNSSVNTNDTVSLIEQVFAYDRSNLELQDYLLMVQDFSSISAIVERVPLLTSSKLVTQAAQKRDLLFSALIARSIYMADQSLSTSLIASIRQLRERFSQKNGLFAMQIEALLRRDSQTELNEYLSARASNIFQITDSRRKRSSDSVNALAVLTLESVHHYRLQLLSVSVVALLVLAVIGYWLLYRGTLQPLWRISQRISDVGSERFPTHSQQYFLRELNTLSTAVAQLDTAQKVRREQEQQLVRANTDLRNVNDELSQFAHVASHDLQEPLRKMQQFSDLLEEDYSSVIDGEGRYYLDAIRNSSQRMSALIKATLTYSRSGRTHQIVELVDLNKVVKELWDEMEIAVSDAQGQLVVDTLPIISANTMGVSQLFRNLILNALKYRQADTFAKIIISVDDIYEEQPEMISIRVKDNGIGVDEQYLERIFTPFERLHTDDVAGTGLGLAICKKVCDAHDWTLLVSSELGVGSTFDIRLPASIIEQ